MLLDVLLRFLVCGGGIDPSTVEMERPRRLRLLSGRGLEGCGSRVRLEPRLDGGVGRRFGIGCCEERGPYVPMSCSRLTPAAGILLNRLIAFMFIVMNEDILRTALPFSCDSYAETPFGVA